MSRGAGASVSRGAGASGPGAAKPPGRAGAPAGAASPGRLASPPAVPGLSIAVTDGRNLARPGDRLAYAVRVDDTGAVSVRRLRVTLTLTSALTIISVSGHGTARAGTVTWTGGLRAGRSASFAVTARVGRIPAGLARLPAVACATPGRHGSVVCAAHLDRVPAAAGRPGPGAAPGGGRTASPLPYVGAGLVVLTVIGVAVVAARVRSRRRPATAGDRDLTRLSG